MDEDRFIAVGRDVLQRDAVEEALTDRVAAEAQTLEPRLPSEATRLIARGIVRQLPSSPVGDEALRRVHALLRRLIAGDGAVEPHDDVIVLDLNPVVEDVVNAVNRQLPRSQRVEVPPSAGRFVLVQEPDLAFAFKVARWFHGIALYVIVLPFVAFGLAVLIASNRPLALLAAGAAVALTAMLRIYLLDGPLQTVVLDAALLVPSARDAGRETYDAIAATFVSQEWWTVIGGVTAAIAGLVLTIVRAAMGEGQD